MLRHPSLLSIYTHRVCLGLRTVPVLCASPHVFHLGVSLSSDHQNSFACLPSIMSHNADIFQIRAYLPECFPKCRFFYFFFFTYHTYINNLTCSREIKIILLSRILVESWSNKNYVIPNNKIRKKIK